MNKRNILPAIAFVLTGLLIPVVEATAVTSDLPDILRYNDPNTTPAWQQEVKVLVAGAAMNSTCRTASVLQVHGMKTAGGIVKDL